MVGESDADEHQAADNFQNLAAAEHAVPQTFVEEVVVHCEYIVNRSHAA